MVRFDSVLVVIFITTIAIGVTAFRVVAAGCDTSKHATKSALQIAKPIRPVLAKVQFRQPNLRNLQIGSWNIKHARKRIKKYVQTSELFHFSCADDVDHGDVNLRPCSQLQHRIQ